MFTHCKLVVTFCHPYYLICKIHHEVNMYRTILVPLDGSKRAEKIIPHVEGLALCYKSKVILLNVVRLPLAIDSNGNRQYENISEETIEKMLQADSYVSAVKDKFENKGVHASTRVICGPIVRVIIETAEKVGADLIAIASHGRTGLQRVFYGSVAAGLLQRVDRPLIVVRARQ